MLSLLPVGSAEAAAGQAGVYNGPGKVTAHSNFTTWLGSPVMYATDYIDYKGGWQKDFIDSRLWLTEPWGKWVQAKAGRKLVLGLPMLQNSNYGQFDKGASGAFDYYFEELAKNMVANGLGSSIIRLGYEANCDTIGPWQATDNPSGYIKHFRHIVNTMRGVSGTSFKFDWTLCNGHQSGNALTSFASFYPGDDYVDIIGMDQYDVKWKDPTATDSERWSANVNRYMGLQDHREFAAARNKPVSFPEWGLYAPGDDFAGGGDSPYFIHKMADWINASNTYYQSYFNLDWGGGVLADFPKGQATYKLRFGPPDTSGPTVTVIAPVSGADLPSYLKVSGKAADPSGIYRTAIYIDGVRYKLASTSSIYYYWKPTAGKHKVTIKARDKAGNLSSKSVYVTR